MDKLEFAANVIDSVAWPLVSILLFFLLRKDLPDIVKYMRRLKYKEFEIEFGESVKEVEREAQKALPTVTEVITISGQPQDQIKDRLNAIVEIAPRSAILEAWLQVEAAAVDVIRKRKMDSLRSLPGPMRLRDYLVKDELLDERQVAIFEQLRVLRNEAVHAPDAQFTTKVVSNYINSALKMAAYLESKTKGL